MVMALGDRVEVATTGSCNDISTSSNEYTNLITSSCRLIRKWSNMNFIEPLPHAAKVSVSIFWGQLEVVDQAEITSENKCLTAELAR
jgi:hypothetical protein